MSNLFDASNLSPESASIYAASLSRNVQATNEALDNAGLQAEPEQKAYALQGDHLDMKLDKAGEATYQASLRANGQAMTDNWHPGMASKASVEAAAPSAEAGQQASNERRQSSGFQM